MDVGYLAGAGIAFVVEDDVVGTEHLVFGGELVGDAGLELGTGGMVALLEPPQAFFEFDIDTDDFVD